MPLPTLETLLRIGAETGYAPNTLEKVARILDLLAAINKDPVLSGKLALKGGTALNVFHLELDRLSVDIDFNYIGATDKQEMQEDCPALEDAIVNLINSKGCTVRYRPQGHGGGKWISRYASVLGGNASMEIDLNFMQRQPLFGASRMESATLLYCLPQDHSLKNTDFVTWVQETVTLCRERFDSLFALSASEQAFLDALLDRGEIDTSLLEEVDSETQVRIAAMPMLAWKAHHVRNHRNGKNLFEDEEYPAPEHGKFGSRGR